MKRPWPWFAGALAAALALGALAAPGNNFRFSILGDRTGTANQAAYEQTWKEITRFRPAFVINVGDSIQGHDGARTASEWDEVRRVWARYRFTLYLVPGNHDVWDEASERLYEKASGRPVRYGFNYQDAHFTVLDNSRTADLDDGQLSFLATDLEANRGRDPKFVFFHKPFWLAFIKLGSGEFRLHQLAKRYGVDYIVSGHGHQFLKLARDGVIYMEVGSSGASMRGLSYSDGCFYQHVEVQVKGAQARLTVKELDPPYGEGRSTAP